MTALEHTDDVPDLARTGNVAFAVGNVQALDLPDASYDVVHAHQVPQHVEGTRRVGQALGRARHRLRAHRAGGERGIATAHEPPDRDGWFSVLHGEIPARVSEE